MFENNGVHLKATENDQIGAGDQSTDKVNEDLFKTPTAKNIENNDN